ncbi:MAG: sulfotransferase [Actinomycetota bacterium]
MDLVPVIGVRLAEGRSGSTLLMQLLGTDPTVVFDRKYPAEYRYLSYLARTAEAIVEPYDPAAHPGVTDFFFEPGDHRSPIPFDSDIVDRVRLQPSLLAGLWGGWSIEARRSHPGIAYYAEKLAVGIEPLVDARIPLRVIDLIRDPRDVLASIKSFTAGGVDGFGRRPNMSDHQYATVFANRFATALGAMSSTPVGVDRVVVRYEDLVSDPEDQVQRLADWLGLDLGVERVTSDRGLFERHGTSASPAASIGRWTQHLDDTETEAVTALLADAVAPYGYQLR